MSYPDTPCQSAKKPPGETDIGLHDLLGHYIKQAQSVINADLHTTLRPFVLRMVTFSALAVLVTTLGLRQTQSSDALLIERPDLVVILDERERRGLILPERVPNDRRAYALRAAPDGKKLFDAARTTVRVREARLFAGIPSEDQARLRAMMQNIWQAGIATRS